MKNRTIYLLILLIAVISMSCGSRKKNLGPTAVDRLIQQLSDEKSFSIILYDMQLNEDENQYQHKYRVKTNIGDSLPAPVTTDWVNVDDAYFAENLDNMGLELASKNPETGKVTKIPSPPGFNNVVGNSNYGQWRTDNSGNSFWAFYGQYMFMSSMFNMMSRPVYRNTYTDYNRYRTNPSTRNNPYYGTGTNRYGTNSPATRASNPSFYQRKQQQQRLSSFRNKVRSNPSRYSRSSSSSSRTSRSRSSSSRSRGGGYGK